MTPALSSGGARLVRVGIIEKTQEVVHQCSAWYSQGSRQRAFSRVCSRRALWRRRRGRGPAPPLKKNRTRARTSFAGARTALTERQLTGQKPQGDNKSPLRPDRTSEDVH